MIAEMIITACLAGDLTKCRDFREPILDEISVADMVTKCSGLTGQLVIVKWSEEHPNWQLKRWGCRPVPAVYGYGKA
jgi:hypothetical protein